MCLLITKPEGAEIPLEHLQNGYDNNSHGCGIAYPSNGRIVVRKGADWKAEDIAAELKKIGSAPALVHFRYMTHGSRVNENTHPFLLPGNVWGAAHNGIIRIPGMQERKDESDTRAFLRSFVSPAIKHLRDKDVQEALAKMIGSGNKIALLHADGTHIILNESQGIWDEGIWYSNNQYSYSMEAYYSNQWEDDYSGKYFGRAKQKQKVASGNWVETEVSTMACDYCGTHISNMDMVGTILINRITGHIRCENCDSFLSNQ